MGQALLSYSRSWLWQAACSPLGRRLPAQRPRSARPPPTEVERCAAAARAGAANGEQAACQSQERD